jgi:hypothetical protein
MPRAPFQVLVLPYRRMGPHVEYAIFRRSDNDAWQGLSLSWEHCEVAWLTFEEALGRLEWESNRTALRELHERLAGRR